MNNHSLQTSVLNSQTNNLYESIQLTFEENYYSTIRKKYHQKMISSYFFQKHH